MKKDIKQSTKEETRPEKTVIRKIDGSVLYESDKETIREAVVEAVKFGVVLFYADLSHAFLSGADLSYADLSDADLSDTDLSGAKTEYCKVNFSSSEKEQAKQFIEGLVFFSKPK